MKIFDGGVDGERVFDGAVYCANERPDPSAARAEDRANQGFGTGHGKTPFRKESYMVGDQIGETPRAEDFI